MPWLPVALKALGTFAVITGVADSLVGKAVIEGITGETMVVDSLVQAIADSQLRFLGSAWACVGTMLWWTSNDLENRKTPLALLGGGLFLGGVGRTLNIAIHGTQYVPRSLVAAIAVELLGPPAVWWVMRGGKPVEAKRK
ncbi:hypothetical protein FQN55_007121 [Onygenales sp. PD_40]|nr:hypothetical protein FQN55_007121 [Onygenales sp. PD_40]KAK2807703.1 hypothetical protein FQN51_000140 [Onygenales sp. PD_10]